MSLIIDAAAHAPVPIETPAGLSEGAWYRTPAASSGVEIATVFVTEESERSMLRVRRTQNVGRDALVKQLVALLRLETGWDSYGAPTISPICAECALGFLWQSRTGPKPSVVPTANAGIQLEWHRGDVDVEIECFPSGHAQLYAEDRASAQTEERWIVPGHPALDTWLSKIALSVERPAQE